MTGRQTTEWAQLAVKFGPGWALAAILVYFLMASVSTAQSDIKSALTQHITDMKLDAQRSGFLLKAICLNGADSESERATCAEAAR